MSTCVSPTGSACPDPADPQPDLPARAEHGVQEAALHAGVRPRRTLLASLPQPLAFARYTRLMVARSGHISQGGVPGKIDQLPFDGVTGIWAPKIKFWDPLGFMGALTPEQKARKRKAELKNGRLAMIGMISFLVGHNLPGAVPALSSAF